LYRKGANPVTEHHTPPEPAGPDTPADADPGAARNQNDPAPPGLAPLPPGGQLLTADEAITAIVTGDHPQSDVGSLPLDAAVIDALRLGVLVACRLRDGRLAFTPAARS
jgi:hypothetical protein